MLLYFIVGALVVIQWVEWFAVFGILFRPVRFLLSLPLHALSRRNEYEADRYAAETLGSGKALSSGLRKLSADSLVPLTPHPFYVFLHHTHPPLVERVRALLKFTPPGEVSSVESLCPSEGLSTRY